jgi:hypothetical protein
MATPSGPRARAALFDKSRFSSFKQPAVGNCSQPFFDDIHRCASPVTWLGGVC